MKLTGAFFGSMVLIAVAASPAFAALGGDSTSVQADNARMKGALRISSAAGVTVHEITTPYGTVIREYLTPAGQVFAVSWQGPVNPDLRQVLGSYYTQYEQAASAPHSGGHRHLTIQQPSLIAQVTGRLRAFQGRAWVPSLVPQNFSVTDIN